MIRSILALLPALALTACSEKEDTDTTGGSSHEVSTVDTDDTTSRRDRLTSGFPSRRSVCFQRMPKSSSCMQIAFFTSKGSPRLVVR